MSRLRMPALACACALALTAVPTAAEETKSAAKKTDQVEAILQALGSEVQVPETTNIVDVPLFELLQDISKRYKLTFIVNEDSFRQAGVENIREARPRLAATQLRGLSGHQFLRVILDSMGATYLVRNNAVEIVSTAYAAKVTKASASQNESGQTQLDEPLVSAVFKEVPLGEAVAKIAETYDLTALVSPQAGDARTGPVSARLLNVPADRALELLALQADLRLVKKGNAYLLTSQNHAAGLAEERLEKERQKIELERLREAPVFPPPAPPRPEK